MEFCKAFNAQTQQRNGTIIPVEITVYEDRSFTFITKTPPAAVLIKEAINLDKGSGEPNRNKVGKITQAQLREIAERSSRPERQRRRAGDEDHRRHRPLDGRGGGGLMARQALQAPRRPRSTASALYSPLEAIALVKRCRARSSTRPSRCTSALGLNVRHADEQLRGTLDAAHGTRPDVTVAVFAQGDKARGRRGRRRRRRRRRPRQAIEEGFDRLRRRDRDARHDGSSAASAACSARGQDAEPEVGTSRSTWQGRRGVQGRQGRVPHRPHRDRAPRDRQGQLRRASSCSRTTRR
jgi:hypothetical protein